MVAADIIDDLKADAGLRAAVADWLRWLALERRAADHTVDAYLRDVAVFIAFAADHRGGAASTEALAAYKPVDFRAFLARRKAEGLGNASLGRALSAVKSLYRFLERHLEGFHNPAVATIRSPKRAVQLPKPLSIKETRATLETAAVLVAEPWLGARDVALLTLLYGCGLRISEALGLNVGERPKGDHLIITGKGGKQRMVPVLTPVRTAIDDYLASAPIIWRRTIRCSSARAGGGCTPASCRSRSNACASPWGWPRPPHPTPCATVSPRTFCRRAGICAAFRNCSATPRSQPRNAIPKSIRIV